MVLPTHFLSLSISRCHLRGEGEYLGELLKTQPVLLRGKREEREEREEREKREMRRRGSD